MKRVPCAAVLRTACALQLTYAAPPAFVDITWMSIEHGQAVRTLANNEVKKALGFN